MVEIIIKIKYFWNENIIKSKIYRSTSPSPIYSIYLSLKICERNKAKYIRPIFIYGTSINIAIAETIITKK